MYSSLKNIQILVELLKKYGIKHIVLSAGTRHTPLVYSVEHDDFFKCYSIVDERSAAFFAIGLIEELKEPVAICCTSGTAAANYVSAANEAFYQQLPLVILTADRNPYYKFQQEEQMIPQGNLFIDVCKRVVTLPHVRDEKDFWYCSRIANEALLELEHRESGPVHINFIIENDYPIVQGIVKFDEEKLPNIRKIDRLTLEDCEDKWKEKVKYLSDKKILIIYGQSQPLKNNEINIINEFCKKFNCVISVDLLANLECDKSIYTFPIVRSLFGNEDELKKLIPDVIITMNGHTVSEIKSQFMKFKGKFEHWHVSKEGNVSDPFKCLPDIIECSPIKFFEKFTLISNERASNKYYDMWSERASKIGKSGSLLNDDIEFSAVYATQQYIKNIPEGALCHIANSNSIRLANFFRIRNNVSVYGNRGAHGIDGSMSAFIGQSYVSKKLSFLLIGDLSFFYDMNAIWNKYVGKNVRIMVINNSGGGIFHNYPGVKNVPTLDKHIAAAHNSNIEGWVRSQGFNYLASHNKEEFNLNLIELMKLDSDKPIIMEVFTDMDVDTECMHKLIATYREEGKSIKSSVSKLVPNGVKKTIKTLIGK